MKEKVKSVRLACITCRQEHTPKIKTDRTVVILSARIIYGA